MDAGPKSTEFLRHERVLWRVLLSLSKSGFFVPPDDARDILHDFYIEAWEGLIARFDPSIASFNTYLAGAFHRFARRRVVQMDQARRRLVDLDEADGLASPELGPAATLQRKQEVTALRSALDELSGLERALLVEHFGEERQSERTLAARHSLTRYLVRATLASALKRIIPRLNKSTTAFVAEEATQSPWHEAGRLLLNTASTRPSTSHPQTHHAVQLGSSQALATRLTTDSLRTKGAPMNPQDQLAIRAALLEGSETALRNLAENARRLRADLTSADDFELDAETLEFLRGHPERLSLLYEVLLADQEADEMTEVERVVEHARAESEVEVGEAFELMAEDLPAALVQWERWFPLGRDDRYREYLASQRSVRAGGPFAMELTRFAMTPDTVAGAMRGLQLLFDERLEEQSPEHHGSAREEPSLLLVGEGRDTEVCVRQMEAQIATGPFVPRLPNMANALTAWIVLLVRERPFCVPNYVFDAETHGQRLAATLLPQWERTARADLRALWTRPVPRAAVREMSYN